LEFLSYVFYQRRLEVLNKVFHVLKTSYDDFVAEEEKKIRYLEAISNYLWLAHSGRFYSSFIEDEICSFAVKFKSTEDAINGYLEDTSELLFISSELYKTGGHTRLLENYAEHLRRWGFNIRLIVTNQSDDCIPERLLTNKNFTNILGLGSLSVLDKFSIISESSNSCTAIYNFQHPDDIIAGIAFSKFPRKKIYVNHADHRFFNGFSSANRVIHIRNYALELFEKRRCISAENVIVPVSVPFISNTISKTDARKVLGIPEQAFVFVTVSSAYKLIPNESYNMPAIIEQIVDEFKQVYWLLVGINKDQYKNLSGREASGRIICCGEIEDPVLHLRASDFFVEGMPVGSTTGLLEGIEAGCFPFLSWGPEFSVSSKNDEIYIQNLVQHPPTKSDFINNIRACIESLTENKDYLPETVTRIRANIREYQSEDYLKPRMTTDFNNIQREYGQKPIEFDNSNHDIGQCKWDYNHYTFVRKEPLIDFLNKISELRKLNRFWLIKNAVLFYNGSFNKKTFLIEYIRLLRLNLFRYYFINAKIFYSSIPSDNILKKLYRKLKV
jgi:hypothetical protein